MKQFHSLFSLVFSLVWLYCSSNIVNGQSNRLSGELKRHIIALDSANLVGESNTVNVGKVINRDFQVLGIGEQSHGTSEFFTARLMLIKSLADDPALTKIGLEAPMGEVEQLNAYLLDGHGDLKAILRSFRLYGYECEEFVELVEHVGRINKAVGKEIRFFGFDMQSPFQSLRNLQNSSVPGNISDSLKSLLGYYALLSNEVYNHSFGNEDFNELKKASELVLGKLEALEQTDPLLLKSIRNYRQFMLLNDPVRGNTLQVQSVIRDSLMAENVLAEVEKDKKMIILAHNAHLQRTPNIFSRSLGSFLAQHLGIKYQCVGLTTSYGFYTTFDPKAGRITNENKVFAGDSNTWEYHFSKLDSPVFVFETAVLKQKTAGVRLPDRYRLLVYGQADNQFFNGSLLDDFDYVLQIRQTSGNRSFYLQ